MYVSVGVLHLEAGFSAQTVQKLKEMGHEVKIVEDGVMFGGYQAIYRDPASGTGDASKDRQRNGRLSFFTWLTNRSVNYYDRLCSHRLVPAILRLPEGRTWKIGCARAPPPEIS